MCQKRDFTSSLSKMCRSNSIQLSATKSVLTLKDVQKPNRSSLNIFKTVFAGSPSNLSLMCGFQVYTSSSSENCCFELKIHISGQIWLQRAVLSRQHLAAAKTVFFSKYLHISRPTLLKCENTHFQVGREMYILQLTKQFWLYFELERSNNVSFEL